MKKKRERMQKSLARRILRIVMNKESGEKQDDGDDNDENIHDVGVGGFGLRFEFVDRVNVVDEFRDKFGIFFEVRLFFQVMVEEDIFRRGLHLVAENIVGGDLVDVAIPVVHSGAINVCVDIDVGFVFFLFFVSLGSRTGFAIFAFIFKVRPNARIFFALERVDYNVFRDAK